MKLTSIALTELFQKYRKAFSKIKIDPEVPISSVETEMIVDAPQPNSPTFLVRYLFKDQASNIDLFLKAFYDPEIRKDWDENLAEQS